MTRASFHRGPPLPSVVRDSAYSAADFEAASWADVQVGGAAKEGVIGLAGAKGGGEDEVDGEVGFF